MCSLSQMTVPVGMHHRPHWAFAGSVGRANKTDGSVNYINPRSVGRLNWRQARTATKSQTMLGQMLVYNTAHSRHDGDLERRAACDPVLTLGIWNDRGTR